MRVVVWSANTEKGRKVDEMTDRTRGRRGGIQEIYGGRTGGRSRI